MASIVLKRGEHIDVQFENADGNIRVGYGYTKVFVKADLPDTKGREGFIYEEIFGGRKSQSKMEEDKEIED